MPAIAVSFLLFLIGVFACYYWLLPTTILFFFRDAQSMGWMPAWTVREYYSFVTRFTIGFGLAFELPVVVLALVRFGLITFEFMRRTRPYAVVLIFVLAAVITPTPDVLTLMAMGLPMYAALRELHLDRVVHGAAETGGSRRMDNALVVYDYLFATMAFVLGRGGGLVSERLSSTGCRSICR